MSEPSLDTEPLAFNAETTDYSTDSRNPRVLRRERKRHHDAASGRQRNHRIDTRRQITRAYRKHSPRVLAHHVNYR
jgi:hypothetical protein